MLRRRGFEVSRKRVARLMRDQGIIGVTRRSKYRTTVRDEDSRRAPDLVDRKFTADGPDKLWVADITHVPTRAGSMYLATILDVWSRKIVGWAIDDQMPAELVLAALEMAVTRRGPSGVVHHSDQGS
jgi:putative transposase